MPSEGGPVDVMLEEHAQGRAVDVNPFHNPYVKGDVVLPELATAYVDRSAHRPGMLTPDDVAGFLGAGLAIGWTVGEISSASLRSSLVIKRTVAVAPLVMATGLALGALTQFEAASFGLVAV